MADKASSSHCSSSATCTGDSTCTSEHEISSIEDYEDLQPPVKKGKSVVKGGSGRFKSSWNLPQQIMASSKGSKFAYCKCCSSHFCISHGGKNDIKRHTEGSLHQRKAKQVDKNASIESFCSTSSEQLHASKVMSDELIMAQFIAAHNIPFQAADHLSDLFR